MKRYSRGVRSGKLHNQARKFRKFKQERYNPFKYSQSQKQFLEQLKLIQQQYEQQQAEPQKLDATEPESTENEFKV